jgi:MFS family permease
MATAIMGIFMTLGFNSSPQFLDWLVQTFEWRGAAVILAGLVGLGMTLIGGIFFRDNPEDCGLEMDGDMTPEWRAKMAVRVPEIHKEFTRGEAVKTLTFWAYSLGPASQGLIITAITFHITSIGDEVGLDRIASYEIFFPGIAIFAICSNLAAGWLSDRIRMKWLLCTMMIAQAIGTLGFLHFDEPVGRFMIMMGHGISGGMFGIMTTASFPRFFGRVHLGEISGLNMSILVMSSAFAPPLFAIAHDIFGSYDQVIVFCALVPLLVFILALKADNPQRHHTP